jgi:opacity protein-like surface antigen
MTKRILAAAALALALDAASPQSVHADWLLTPYLGVTFGGDTPKQQVNYGLSAAFLGNGILGLEVDASLTPNFFDSDSGLIDDSNVSTLMANLMVAAPAGAPLRPYASGGVGIIRSKATSVGNFFDIEDNSFGVNLGGGVLAQVGTRVGIRGDLRYFRAVQDSDGGDDLDLDLAGFNFWRGTLGVTFRF